MKGIHFVVGGCKSGKSAHALGLADASGEGRKVFIATCVPRDEEMTLRVRRHQAERDAAWRTVEAPIRLPEAVEEHGKQGTLVLADCLTLWITNLLMEEMADADLLRRVDRLVEVLAAAGGPVILVSNEVGAGIVPENRLARRFRDLVGTVNQRVAAAADRVVWTVAGIPVVIKGVR